jgi:hypothetical protein
MHLVKRAGAWDLCPFHGGDLILLSGQYLFPFGVRFVNSLYRDYPILSGIENLRLCHGLASCGTAYMYYSKVSGAVRRK